MIAIIIILVLNLLLIWKNKGAFVIIILFYQRISVLIIVWVHLIELIQLIDVVIWLSVPRILLWIDWVQIKSILFVNILCRHLMLNFQRFLLHHILFFQKLELFFRFLYFSILLLKILLVLKLFIINYLLLLKFFLFDLILIDAFKFSFLFFKIFFFYLYLDLQKFLLVKFFKFILNSEFFCFFLCLQ